MDNGQAGMPPHERTDENARLVEILSAAGETQETIGNYIGISRWTLRKYYAEELENGGDRFLAKLKTIAMKKAEAGDPQMLRYVLNCRAGWSERTKVEVTGANGVPLNVGLYPAVDLTALTDEELETYAALHAKTRPQLPASASANLGDLERRGGADSEGEGEA
jgi:DNA-binding XRE family transcriptional regulator